MQRLGLWLVTACLIAAGCIGAVAQGTPAMEHRSTADEQARDVHPEADLIGVGGFEANETIEPERDERREDPREEQGEAREEEEFEYRPPYPVQDDRIGDGAPPAWAYTYRLDNATYKIVVGENGTVLHKERLEEHAEEAHAIEDWQVTSIEAVEIIQENNASWVIDDQGMAFYHLERENATSDPIWNMGESHEDYGFVFARVNATTGEFLGAHALTFDFDFDFNWSGGDWDGDWDGDWGGGWSDDGEVPPQEGGSFSDSVSAADDTNEHTFELDHDHPELAARLALEEPATGTVQATITSPEGSEVGTLEAGPDDQVAADEFSHVMDGENTVTVELTDGLDQSYTLDWCADGQETGDDDAEAACERVEEANEDERLLAPGPAAR